MREMVPLDVKTFQKNKKCSLVDTLNLQNDNKLFFFQKEKGRNRITFFLWVKNNHITQACK